jgi:hypothetical protein
MTRELQSVLMCGILAVARAIGQGYCLEDYRARHFIVRYVDLVLRVVNVRRREKRNDE